MSVVFYILKLQTETFTEKLTSLVCENYGEEMPKTGKILETKNLKVAKKLIIYLKRWSAFSFVCLTKAFCQRKWRMFDSITNKGIRLINLILYS